MPSTITWLHVSDLHLGNPRDDFDEPKVVRTLLAQVRRLCADEGVSPDMIFFTGDAVWGELPGKPIRTQFEAATQFFRNLREAVRADFPAERLYLVPGNHDVNRNVAKQQDPQTEWLDNRKRKDRGLNEVLEMIRSGNETWQHFMRRLDDYQKFLSGAKYSHLVQDPARLTYNSCPQIAGLKVGLAGFNTAWSCGRDGERGNLWMGAAYQVQEAGNHLLEADFRIALIHHPPGWLVEQEGPQLLPLVEQDFRFLLHGHEHREGVDSRADGFNLISAAAAYDGHGTGAGFNVVRLDVEAGDGWVWPHRYFPETGAWGYRVIRDKTDAKGRWPLTNLAWLKALGAKRRAPAVVPPEPPPVRVSPDAGGGGVLPEATPDDPAGPDPVFTHPAFEAESHSKIWDLTLPSGELVTSDFYRGFRCIDPTQTVLRLYTRATSMTEAQCSVSSSREEFPVEIERTEHRSGDSSTIDYRLVFKRPLGDNRIDLLVQRRLMSAALTSRESQRWYGVPADKWGEEMLSTRMSVGCKNFQAVLRFWTEDPSLVPHDVSLHVRNDLGKEDRAEEDSDRLCLTYWSSGLIERMARPLVRIRTGRAFLSVHAPRPNYRYGFRWRLPENEPAHAPEELDDARARLRNLPGNNGALKAGKQFLRKLVEACRKLLKDAAPVSKWKDPDLFAALFAFDPASGLLPRVCVYKPALPSLAGPFRWGQDIIGTAFQSRAAYGFNRRAAGDTSSLIRLSSSLDARVQVLYAFPLLWPDAQGHSVGVVALASPNGDSALKVVNTSPDVAGKLNVAIQNQWRQNYQTLLGSGN